WERRGRRARASSGAPRRAFFSERSASTVTGAGFRRVRGLQIRVQSLMRLDSSKVSVRCEYPSRSLYRRDSSTDKPNAWCQGLPTDKQPGCKGSSRAAKAAGGLLPWAAGCCLGQPGCFSTRNGADRFHERAAAAFQYVQVDVQRRKELENGAVSARGFDHQPVLETHSRHLVGRLLDGGTRQVHAPDQAAAADLNLVSEFGQFAAQEPSDKCLAFAHLFFEMMVA